MRIEKPNRLFFKISWVVFWAVLASLSWSNSILLQGHILDSQNNPIEGIQVGLKQNGLVSQTDKNGYYILMNVATLPQVSSRFFSMKGNVLQLDCMGSKWVKIQILSSKGELLSLAFHQKISGLTKIDLSKKIPENTTVLVRLEIDNQTQVFRVKSLLGQVESIKFNQNQTIFANDTLVIKHQNQKIGQIPVNIGLGDSVKNLVLKLRHFMGSYNVGGPIPNALAIQIQSIKGDSLLEMPPLSGNSFDFPLYSLFDSTKNWTAQLLALNAKNKVLAQSELVQYGDSVSQVLFLPLTIPKESQSITVSAIPNHVYGDADFVVNAVATSSLDVDMTSITPNQCLVINNKIHIKNVGTCSLSFSQPGNNNYLAATSISLSFDITPQLLNITPQSDIKYIVGESVPFISYTIGGVLKSGDSITGALSMTPARDSVVIGTLSAGVNYQLSLTPRLVSVLDSSVNFRDDRDQKIYKKVKIGAQIWMAENLNFGNMEKEVSSENYFQTLNTKMCYDNDTTECNSHGGLYQWHVAVHFPAICDSISCDSLYVYPYHQGICPNGWHISTKTEWNDLQNFLSVNNDAATKLKLKNTGFTRWDSDSLLVGGIKTLVNDGNSSQFSAYPTGNRDYSGGFGNKGYSALYWTSKSKTGGIREVEAEINGSYPNLSLVPNNKTFGFGVRCIKNGN